MRNNLDLGEEYIELTINNDENRVIKIDLTDFGIVERINESYKRIDEFQKEHKDIKINSDGTVAEDFAQSAEVLSMFNKLIRELIDYILDAKVSDIVFGNKNPLSMVKGVPLYGRFINALMPYVEKIAKREQAETEKRISKYTKVIK